MFDNINTCTCHSFTHLYRALHNNKTKWDSNINIKFSILSNVRAIYDVYEQFHIQYS